MGRAIGTVHLNATQFIRPPRDENFLAGWAQHTGRGFFAGLKKRGHTVEVLNRVRQVGPNKTGAKGSFTVYRIAS